MESQYHKLNPSALATATAVAAIVVSLFVGFPMLGFGGMMHGYGEGGSMMGRYGSGYVLGFGLMWIVGALVAALAGAVVAWVYNAVNAAQSNKFGGIDRGDRTQLPRPR